MRKLSPGEYKKKSQLQSLFLEPWHTAACREFVVLDIETTGLHKVHDGIVEIAAIRYEHCRETASFFTMVNPLRPIPAGATAVHGITDDMVLDAPTLADVLPSLLDFLGDSLIVGHWVNFDLSFIEIGARRMGLDPVWNYLDTISIAKKLIPGLANYRQGTVLAALGITQERAHRAEDDCRGCSQIALFGIEQVKENLAAK